MSNSSAPSVFVVILNFNGKETLLNCLSAVYQSDYENFEVVVVDNASTDGSFETARKNYSRAHFIKNSSNIGFSQGNNIGIRFALEKFADFIFVLNNDAIIERDTISNLVVEAKKAPRTAILSPLILGPDSNSVWFAGGKILWREMKNIHLCTTTQNNPYESEYISGCAMFINKEVFKKIGLFDERFFLYYEDADFSLRAKKAGFNLLIIPSCKITHFEQSNNTNPEKLYWLVLSAMIFFNTHTNFYGKVWHFFYLRLRKIKNTFNLIVAPNEQVRQVRKAYKDYRKLAN